MAAVRELVTMIRLHNLPAEVLVASVRSPRDVTEAALLGAHIATVPFEVLRKMVSHPLTASGIAKFRADWDAVQAKPQGRQPDAP